MDPAPEVRRLVEAHRLPGLVAVRFDPHRLQTFAAGEVGEDARFPLASVTKTFTAAMVLRAAKEGLLALDAPLRSVLTDFELADARAARDMTFRDALCHFSGLPPHTWAWVYGDLDRADWIATRLPHLESAGPHRETHRYSNILYAVLGQALQQVEGRPWEDLLAERITRPLGLRTIEPLRAHWAEEAPPPYRMTPEGPKRTAPFVARWQHPMAPAGELRGRLDDVARWGQHHLREGAAGDAWLPHNRVSDSRPHPAMGPLDYGLGWRLDRVRGARRVWHSGQCSGYSLLLSLHPERGCGLAAATPVSGAVDVLHALDLRLHHRLEPGWAHVRREKPRSAEKTQPVSSAEIPPGRYRHPGYGVLEIDAREEGLRSRFQTSAWSRMTRPYKAPPRIRLEEYDVDFAVQKEIDGGLSVWFGPEGSPIHFKPLP